jgi:DNA-binding NarL/FixJ family response regulator
MKSVTVGLISNDQFFREGLNALLTEEGYSVAGSVSNHREFNAVVSADQMPALVLVDLERDIDAAADQLGAISNNLPGVTIVGFSDESESDWLVLCEDYEVSALLRKQVSFKALLHSLELAMMGEKVMPTNFEPSTRHKCDDARPCAHGHHGRGRSSRPKGEVIPCMTCSRPFETEDRRANRICSSCKTRMSRVSGAIDHTLHY